MMASSTYNEETYDDVATNIIYCKLFPLIMDDFVTRMDAQEMMKTSNLIAPLTGTAPPPAGVITGTAQITPIYNGGFAHGTSQSLKAQRQAEKEKGGLQLEAPVTILKEVWES